MKLPSGKELTKDQLIDIFEAVVSEKFMMECTFEEAFELTGYSLHEGEWDDIPVLHDDDISFIYKALSGVVIQCEGELRSTLGTFEVNSAIIQSW